MDPFFHQSGRPWTIDFGHVWVLVRGTPEEIAELNPYVDLPKPKVTEADQATIDRFAGIVDVVDVVPEALEDGRIAKLTNKGYEVFNILKGSVILVKRQNKSPSPQAEEAANNLCPECGGTGSITEPSTDPAYEGEPIFHTCDKCGGSGLISPEEVTS